MGHTFSSCKKCGAINKIKIENIVSNQAVCGKCQAPLTLHKIVSEESEVGLLKIIEKSDLPVIVDFWAPWCGPCRSFAPTFETVSDMEKGHIVFLKINTEQYPNISQKFNIRGIPSLLVFKNGKEIARESGAFPLHIFMNWVTQYR